MSVCTFFGHRQCPREIESVLKNTIINLIEEKNVTRFYVGDSGDFDRMVLKVLKELKSSYSFGFYVISAYMPTKIKKSDTEEYFMLPEGIENIPPRFAIDYRNNYMLSKSDFVVTYTVVDFGGAAEYADKARRKKKCVINLAEFM